MTQLDLTWGDPGFLHDLLTHKNKVVVRPKDGLSYNKKGSGELRAIIQELHKQHKNVKDVDRYHIVIGNGATHLLAAAVHSLEGHTVGAFAPYYTRFPSIADAVGKEWVNSHKVDILIATVPNNPDGSWVNRAISKPNTIFDLCYNWPIYTDSVWEADGDILIYNLSKSVGHAGSRIGWALVKDEKLAHKMQMYIEHTSCGVSYEAQERAKAILWLTARRKNSIIVRGRKELRKRWAELKATNAPIINSSGMFAWCYDPKWWEALGVTTVLGTAFGDDPNKCRINIGCDRTTFDELLRRIHEHNRKCKEEVSGATT